MQTYKAHDLFTECLLNSFLQTASRPAQLYEHSAIITADKPSALFSRDGYTTNDQTKNPNINSLTHIPEI